MLSLMLYAGSTNAHLQQQRDGQLRKAVLQDGQPGGQPDGQQDWQPDGQHDGQPGGQQDGQPDGQHDGQPDRQHDGQHEGQQKDGVLPDGQQEDAHQDPPVEIQNNDAGQYISLVNVLAAAVHKVALCTCMNVAFICHADLTLIMHAVSSLHALDTVYAMPVLLDVVYLLLLRHILPMGPMLLLGAEASI